MKRTQNAGWFRQGYDPRRARGGGVPGRGGVKGRSGRKPDPWQLMLRRMRNRSRANIARVAHRVLDDANHPAWLSCWQWCVEQAYGKLN